MTSQHRVCLKSLLLESSRAQRVSGYCCLSSPPFPSCWIHQRGKRQTTMPAFSAPEPCKSKGSSQTLPWSAGEFRAYCSRTSPGEACSDLALSLSHCACMAQPKWEGPHPIYPILGSTGYQCSQAIVNQRNPPDSYLRSSTPGKRTVYKEQHGEPSNNMPQVREGERRVPCCCNGYRKGIRGQKRDKLTVIQWWMKQWLTALENSFGKWKSPWNQLHM